MKGATETRRAPRPECAAHLKLFPQTQSQLATQTTIYSLSNEKVMISEPVIHARKIKTYILHFIGFLYGKAHNFKSNQYSKWKESHESFEKQMQ